MNSTAHAEPPVPVKQESETPSGAERTVSRKVYVPQVDILENDSELVLLADLPGVDLSGVEITIEKNVLTVRGKVAQDAPEGFKLTYEEYGVGDYERAFSLSNEVDREGIQAAMKDGVLRVTLPKVRQEASRKIAVVPG